MKRARPRKTGWRCSRPSRHFTNTILKAHCSSPRSARRPLPVRQCRHGTGTAFGSAREAGQSSHCIQMTLTRYGAYLTLPTSTPKQNACQSYGRCAPGTCRWRSPPCGRRGALRRKPVAACRSMLRSWKRQWTASPTIATIFWTRTQPACFPAWTKTTRKHCSTHCA